jgi:uroporphyrin-III C-methyltransferase/precorrin-2 dehydrogenase/sirohydrochlorin ferrochelatase
MDYLPVFLRVTDQPVLIVGGGEVALRKAEWFLKAGAQVTVVAPVLHADLAAQVAAHKITHIAAAFAPAPLTGKMAAVAATDECPRPHARAASRSTRWTTRSCRRSSSPPSSTARR